MTYLQAHAMAGRIRWSRFDKLQATCKAAGIGGYHGCVLHNALLSANEGRPWPGVDTGLLRQAYYTELHMFDGYAIVDRWARRKLARGETT